MSKNIERILSESGNRAKEEDDASLMAGYKDYVEKRDKYLPNFIEAIRMIRERIEAMKEHDRENAEILNKEFDRLITNMEGKKGEELQKAQEEFEDFRKRLNAIIESKEK